MNTLAERHARGVGSWLEQDYTPAPKGFLEFTGRLNCTTQKQTFVLPGFRDLSTDALLVDPADAQRAVVILSGTHALEVRAGSGQSAGSWR